MLCRQSSTLWQKKIREVSCCWVKAKEVSGAVAGIERVLLESRQSPLSHFRLLLGNEAYAHSALPTQWREKGRKRLSDPASKSIGVLIPAEAL